MALETTRPLFDKYLTGEIANVSSASSFRLPIPSKGRLKKVLTVLGGAITSGDAVITVSVDGTSVGTITVANASSAEGDVDTLELPDNDQDAVADEGGWLEFATDGGSTNSIQLGIVAVWRELT